MLSDSDRRALLEIERRFHEEDPDFGRTFHDSEHRLRGSPGVAWWLYTFTIGCTLALSGLMVLAGLPIAALMFAAATWGVWHLRGRRQTSAGGQRAARSGPSGRRTTRIPAAATPATARTPMVGVSKRGEQAPVVVGVDGSTSGRDALDWAVAEAVGQRRPLRIVQAFTPPVTDGPLDPTLGRTVDGPLPAAAERVLDEAVARARCAGPDLDVPRRLVAGATTPALLAMAQDARLLVLGSPSVSGFSNRRGGSVGVAVVCEARCPVVIIRPRPDQRRGPSAGRVVVGVGDTDLTSPAIRFAFETAARRGIGVTAVHAWSPAVASYAGCNLAPAIAEICDEQERRQQLLLQALLGVRRNSPDVDVKLHLVRGSPGQVLVGESPGAELVVVGSRGLGALRGTLLGSVSQTLLRHADCPVAVVRADHTPTA